MSILDADEYLQNYAGNINFASDAWTSPNHKAFVAITAHFLHEDQPISMLLDIVEVATSHTGKELADVFAQVLEGFGIADKVCYSVNRNTFI
jgi:hypothetical protein